MKDLEPVDGFERRQWHRPPPLAVSDRPPRHIFALPNNFRLVLGIEYCTAPRPSEHLRGSREAYMMLFARVARLVHVDLYPGRENVVVIGNNQRPQPKRAIQNDLPTPQYRPPPVREASKELGAAPPPTFVPRIGAFEVAVVLHTPSGCRLGPTLISSKLTTGRWPKLDRLAEQLRTAVETLAAAQHALKMPIAMPKPLPSPPESSGANVPQMLQVPHRPAPRLAPQLAQQPSPPPPPPPPQPPSSPSAESSMQEVPSVDLASIRSPRSHHGDLLGRASPPGTPEDGGGIDWLPIAAAAAATVAALPTLEVPPHHAMTVRIEYCTAARPGRYGLVGSTRAYHACYEQLVTHLSRVVPAASLEVNVPPTTRRVHRRAPGLSDPAGANDERDTPPLFEKIGASLVGSSRARSAARLPGAPRAWAMHGSNELARWTNPKSHRPPPALPAGSSSPTWAPRVNAFEVSVMLQGPSAHAIYGPAPVYSKLSVGQLPLRHDRLLRKLHRAAGGLIAAARKPGGSAFHELIPDGRLAGPVRAGVSRSVSAGALLVRGAGPSAACAPATLSAKSRAQGASATLIAVDVQYQK